MKIQRDLYPTAKRKSADGFCVNNLAGLKKFADFLPGKNLGGDNLILLRSRGTFFKVFRLEDHDPFRGITRGRINFPDAGDFFHDVTGLLYQFTFCAVKMGFIRAQSAGRQLKNIFSDHRTVLPEHNNPAAIQKRRDQHRSRMLNYFEIDLAAVGQLLFFRKYFYYPAVEF